MSIKTTDVTGRQGPGRQGPGQVYWTVEEPDLTGGPLTGVVDLAVPFPVTIDLATLAAPK